MRSRLAAAVLAAIIGLAVQQALAQATFDQEAFDPTAPSELVPLFAAPPAEAVGSEGPWPQFGTWGFDLTGMDPDARPGDSFFEHADGRWIARAAIPPDRSRYGMFEILTEKTESQLLGLIEDAARADAAVHTPVGQIGALYRAYMDEVRIETLDAAPIAGDLDGIRSASSHDDIAALMGRGRGGFATSFFALNVSPDDKDPTAYAIYAAQSGLGLPDRDYYLKDAFKAQLARYRDYAARLLDMIGWADAERSAAAIIGLEARIAEASWSRAESRERDKTYNALSPADLAAYAPGFSWARWLAAAGLGDPARIVIRQKSAFPKLAKVFAETPLETLKAWQAFRLVDQTAPYLSKRFVDARFAFRNGVLAGQIEERPRTKRAVGLIDGAIGEAVGREYVARYFSPQSKERMEELVVEVARALRGRIERVSWMTPATRAKALEKLDLVKVKIGYPAVWRDYSVLRIDPDDLVGNMRRASTFRWAYARSHLGKQVDPDEWQAMPQVVNAYYGATRGEIVFPAAILQPPFFDPRADMAVNYGGIGGVIGHELTHGFDDQGRKSDGIGVLTDWWQAGDAARFEAEAKKLGAQYNSYAVAPGLNVKGAQTLGENIADLGGILLALDAYRASLKGAPSPILDGYTGEQRVFLAWAQVWRDKSRPEALKQLIAANSHSPPRFRVDGPMRNIDAWYEAWGVKPGDRLYLKPEDRVRIW